MTAPSRETDQRSATKTQEGLGRLWNVQQEQRESSGIRIEGSQSPGSNPAPMHGQSKTGLTESHSGAPTQAEPALSAEQIEHCRRYGVTTAMRYALCDAALSSLTARDEGIEAAAKWHDEQAKVNRAAGLANAASISELDAISIRALKGQP